MPKVNKPQLRFIVRGDKLALRCTFNGQSAEVKTDLSSEGFDKKKQMYKGNRKGNIEIDKMLSICEERIEEGVVDVKKILTSDIPSKSSFTYIIEKYIKENDLRHSTIKMWRTMIGNFIDCFGADDATLFDGKTFIKYMVEKDMSDSTLYLYISKCRALGLEIDKKITKKFKPQKRDYCLNDSQILNIMRYYGKVVHEHREDEIAGWAGFEFFCLMLRTGLAPVDLFKLKRNQFTFYQLKGEKYLSIKGKRSKTGIAYKIVLPKYHMVYAIYKKYDGCEHYFDDAVNKDNKVSQFLEYYIKKVRKIIGSVDDSIDVNKVTFYTARHSLITSLLGKNIPPAQLALFLGRSINTISTYFHGMETEQMTDILKYV